AIYALFGHRAWVVQVFNAALAVLAAARLRLLAAECRGDHPVEPALGRAGTVAALLVLLLPSFVYFTALNLKEALVLYATVGSLLWFLRLQRAPGLPEACLLLADVALLAFVRAQAAFILAVGAGIAWVVGLAGARRPRRPPPASPAPLSAALLARL